MAKFQHKENMGSLMPNQYKDKDTHPDLRGQINVGGKVLDIAAWKRTFNSGDPYLSLKVSEPYVKPGEESQPAQTQQDNSEIPF